MKITNIRCAKSSVGIMSLCAAIAFTSLSTTGQAALIVPDPDKLSAELPRVSTSRADKLGLERWRDLDSGKEVRRAQAVNPYKARVVIRNDTGLRIKYSLKWGQSGTWESYIVERKTNRYHVHPSAKVTVPYIRFENTDRDSGRAQFFRRGNIVEHRGELRAAKSES
jgi:hypothetical protein